MASPRTRAAVALGRATRRISRRLGQGRGAVIGGRMTSLVAPQALHDLAAGMEAVAVSGTNGKTTTTKLVATALRTLGPVVSNIEGANLPNGVLSALLEPHEPGARLVAEVDERWVSHLLARIPFRVVTLLNLSRDQIDRMAEVRSNAVRWRTALAAAPHRPTVVGNADDPLIVYAVPPGLDAVWVHAGLRWRWDALACPACGGRVDFDDGGQWGCRRCGFSRPPAQFALVDRGAAVEARGERVPLELRLPGTHTRANAAVAMATVSVLGVEPRAAAAAFATVEEVDGRYRHVWPGGRLFLAKNPAGWAEVLEVLAGTTAPLVIAFNANGPDGRDPSWLYDVPLEHLQGRRVIVTGERATDLSVRLRYAGVEHDVEPSLTTALDAGRALHADVLATYTAFGQVKRVLDGE
jgi:UDP-N-acetylmuramyl tripeptide synthase